MRRVARWLARVVAEGAVFWLITIGASAAVSAVAAALSGLGEPWIYLFAVGVFLFGAGSIIALIRLAIALMPTNWQQALGERRTPRTAALPTLPNVFLPKTPRQQLTDLIEEGARLLARIPETARDPRGRLIESLSGVTVDHPALVYEWESRVWRLLSSRAFLQWRGLYGDRPSPQPYVRLRQHLADRIKDLRTILARA